MMMIKDKQSVRQGQSSPFWHRHEPIRALLQTADHVDVKQFESQATLRQFLANMFSYYPGWIKFLYGVRWGFVRLLGMKQEGVPQISQLQPEEIKMTAGEKAAFFTVKAAEEGAFYLSGATESHLTAHLGVVREPLAGNNGRFHLITIVHYHRWTGPIYFNVIRPFHHLIVNQMGKAGAKT